METTLRQRKALREEFIEALDRHLIYKVIEEDEIELIEEAAKCLAATFAGVQVKDAYVSEPMTLAAGMSLENFTIFVHEYMKAVIGQRCCYVAMDRNTEEVIGVVACEDFNPDEEAPVFSDELEPMNKIIDLLMELDERFVGTYYEKVKDVIEPNELLHLFMIGVKLEKCRKEIAVNLIKVCEEDAMNRGYKACFMEATNKKSAGMVTKYCGYELVDGLDGQSILTVYKETEHFKTVPVEASEDCRILYKAFDSQYKISK